MFEDFVGSLFRVVVFVHCNYIIEVRRFSLDMLYIFFILRGVFFLTRVFLVFFKL